MSKKTEDRITRLENAIADYIDEARVDRIESRIERKERHIEMQELRALTAKVSNAVIDLVDSQKNEKD